MRNGKPRHDAATLDLSHCRVPKPSGEIALDHDEGVLQTAADHMPIEGRKIKASRERKP